MENAKKLERQESARDADLKVFDLSSAISQTETQDTWSLRDRSALTLGREAGLHVTLIAMHAGTTKPWHAVECPISLQVLQGRLDFITDRETVPLKQGGLIVLRAGVRHHMRVHEESVVLLSLGAVAK